MTIVLLVALFVAQPTVPAQFVGKTIVVAEIFVEGERHEDPMTRDLVETRAGQPLAMADVRESIAHLFSLGRYQDIQVEAFEVPGGVRVRFNLEPIHSVQKVDFEGELELSEGTLRNAITERYGATPSIGRATDVAQLLQEVYNERGYLNAAIRPRVQVLHDPDRSILIFEVNAGPVSRVRNVTLDGDPGEPREAFLRRIHADAGRVYERVEVDKRLAEFVNRQRRDGRYEATAAHRYRPLDDGMNVDLTVEVDRGPGVVVEFTGDPLPPDQLDDLVPVKREGSVDTDLIEDSERRIVEFLSRQGYWKAAVSSSRQQTDARLDIIFNVKRGLQYRLAQAVEVVGNKAVPLADLRALLLQLNSGDLFVESNLDAAVAKIRGVYLQRGFAQVKVSGDARELNPNSAVGMVQPTITIAEGPLTRIGTVTFEGNKAIPTTELASNTRAAKGVSYYEPSIVQDIDSLVLLYRNRGFATANINVAPTLSDDASQVDLAFRITEGPQTIIDHILIVGNVRTDPNIILREVQFKAGGPLGLGDVITTRSRIAGLGLFRRVQISEITHAESNRTDVLITVEESPATSYGYGGGLEAGRRLQREQETGGAQERLEFAPRGFFQIGRRNIAGKNRSVNLYTRLALRPESDAANSDGGAFGFEEYRVVGTYREPKPFGLGSDILITGLIEQGVRSSFNFARKGVTADIEHTITRRRNVRLNYRYALTTTKTFDLAFIPEDNADTAAIERIFPQVRVSAFSAVVARDTRDDVVDPASGMFLSGEGTFAARAIGGEVGFIKSYTQALYFRRLPSKRRVVFAGRIGLGLADGFPREVQAQDPQGNPIEGLTVTVEDLPASDRFFAGGDSTIRGFALDTVGAEKTITPAGFPRGGNAVILLNAELRTHLFGDFGAVAFVDGGNVFERATQLDLGNLRGSVGLGARYRSPIGPIRIDVGFKLDRRRLGTELERPWDFHFSIGHAF